MTLTYYPDTDTLDVDFHIPGGGKFDSLREARDAAQEVVSRTMIPEKETETYEADPSGQTLAHYREGQLTGFTVEHASRRAPGAWKISSLREEAAQVAASTGLIVERVTYDLVTDHKSFHTGEHGPHSPYSSDKAVQEYNRMVDEAKTASTTA